MNNAIPGRIFDFLFKFPPFHFLAEAELKALAERVVVQYQRPATFIFNAGEESTGFFYVVRQGAVHLLQMEGENEMLVDTCDEGDVLGIRPFLANQPYLLTARAEEESLLYAIPGDWLTDAMANNPRLAIYLARTIAVDTQRRYGQLAGNPLMLAQGPIAPGHPFLSEVLPIHPKRPPVCCASGNTIQQAAQTMTRERVSSIVVVNPQGLPIGILTDKDFRQQVATGRVSVDHPVDRIMSAPVITIGAEVTQADVQMQMIKHRIHHLVVTDDGTPNTPVAGVLTEHDLLVAQGDHPAVLLRRIRRAHSDSELREIREQAEKLLRKYLYQEVSIAFISSLMTEINDALIQRMLERETERTRPPVSFCWLTLGSEGRGEQLLRTDQDNALVFADPEPGQCDSVQSFFIDLAQRVNRGLAACGFEYCPADMMARNPQRCLSLTEWKQQFSRWLDEPDPKAVLHSTIFFDFRPVYGNYDLADALTEHIFHDLDQKSVFLHFLAKQALKNPPPLTFFRSFVVERSGEHKNEFDIKGRAMMPLADAARVLILGSRVGQVNNTFRRFERLAALEPQNADVYLAAAEAYEMFMRYRALKGLENNDSGRYFSIADLTKLEKVNLRHAFHPIRQLQQVLMTRYQLAQMM